MNALESWNKKRALRAGIVGRAIAGRNGDADIGLPIVEQEKANTAADGRERKSFAKTVTGVPCGAGVNEAVELVAAPVSIVDLLVEAQFERAGDAVVAADLGAAVATAERDAAEIELLRGKERI